MKDSFIESIDKSTDETNQRVGDVLRVIERIESAQMEWEKNQRWQINQIRDELKAINKAVSFFGLIGSVAAGLYIWRTW